jgi:hypothetical protein
MAKRVRKSVKKQEQKPCITCGKQFTNDFKSIVNIKKKEFELKNINYYVYKNQNNVWAIAESVSFGKIKTESTEYFHISEFKPD